MGCGASTASEHHLKALAKQARLFERDVRRLGLTEAEVALLFGAFCEVDSDGAGVLSEAKFTTFLHTNAREKKEQAHREEVAARELARKEEARAKAAKLKGDSQGAEAKAKAIAAKKEAERPRTAAELEEQRKIDQAAHVAALAAAAQALADLQAPRRKYGRRLFQIFSRSGRGECDFGEFMCSCVEYLTPLPWTLIRFAFAVYDADGAGALLLQPGASGGLGKAFAELDVVARAKGGPALPVEVNVLELLLLTKEVLDASSHDVRPQAQRLSALVDGDLGTLRGSLYVAPAVPAVFGTVRKFRSIDEAEFARFALKNPAMLYPAFRLQEALALRLGGHRLFAALVERRALEAKIAPLVLRQSHELLALVPSCVLPPPAAAKRAAAKRRVSTAAVGRWYAEGLELVPIAINRLAGTLALEGHVPYSPDDFAPDTDAKFLKLTFHDIFGKLAEMRRHAKDATMSSSSSSSKRLDTASKRASEAKLMHGASGRKILPAMPLPATSRDKVDRRQSRAASTA